MYMKKNKQARQGVLTAAVVALDVPRDGGEAAGVREVPRQLPAEVEDAPRQGEPRASLKDGWVDGSEYARVPGLMDAKQKLPNLSIYLSACLPACLPTSVMSSDSR